MRSKYVLLLLSLYLGAAHAAQATFDAETKTWTLDNGLIRATLQFANGRLTAQTLRDLKSDDVWRAPSGAAAGSATDGLPSRMGTPTAAHSATPVAVTR